MIIKESCNSKKVINLVKKEIIIIKLNQYVSFSLLKLSLSLSTKYFHPISLLNLSPLQEYFVVKISIIQCNLFLFKFYDIDINIFLFLKDYYVI